MIIHDIAQTVSEFGSNIVFIGLCVWLVVTVGKSLVQSQKDLSASMEKFTDRVRTEHDRSCEQHEKMIAHLDDIGKQHVEIMHGLGRINGYKG